MNTLENILEEWEIDSIIDDSNISKEILKIPKLHAKYLISYNNHKIAAIKQKFNYEKLKEIKISYYLGQLDKETLNKYGWKQFDILIKTKSGIDQYINSDTDLIKILQKKLLHEQTVTICESILQELKQRTWQLKSLIDYEKFKAGV